MNEGSFDSVVAVSDKRRRILDAAADLIVQNGLQSPMSAIAEAAGVATGSLYNYFSSKEDLILSVYREYAAASDQIIIEHPEPGLTYQERMTRYFLSYVDFIWADERRSYVVDFIGATPFVPVAEAGKIFARFIKYSRALFEEGQKAGLVKLGDPNMMGSFCRGAIRNTLRRHRTVHGVLHEKERQQIAAMCWSAVAV